MGRVSPYSHGAVNSCHYAVFFLSDLGDKQVTLGGMAVIFAKRMAGAKAAPADFTDL
jgi:hypothetical protein